MTSAFLLQMLVPCWTELNWHLIGSNLLNLKIEAKRCYFFQASMIFPSHALSTDGISGNTEKVEKVRDWPVSKEFQGTTFIPQFGILLPAGSFQILLT